MNPDSASVTSIARKVGEAGWRSKAQLETGVTFDFAIKYRNVRTTVPRQSH